MTYEHYFIDGRGIFDLEKVYGDVIRKDLVVFGQPDTQEQFAKFCKKLREEGEEYNGAAIRSLIGAKSARFP